MTVKELIKKLEQLDPDLKVLINVEAITGNFDLYLGSHAVILSAEDETNIGFDKV